MPMRVRGAWLVVPLIAVLGSAATVAWPRPEIRTLSARVHTELTARGGCYVPLSRMPSALLEAIVAAEDERFYAHHGVDLVALGRAAVADVRAGRVVEGGSTLTEQLADVVLVHGDRTPLRRLMTMVLAWQIERVYAKAQILELYLNAVYFGHRAYGIGRAARVYFGSPPDRLDLGQSALLAGLPQAPSAYDPLRHPRVARRRAAEVLAAMVRLGDIVAPTAASASAELRRGLAPYSSAPAGCTGS